MEEELSLPPSHESHEVFVLLQGVIDAWHERKELVIVEGKRPMLEEYLAMICADTDSGDFDQLVHDHAAFIFTACSLPGESMVNTRKRLEAAIGTEYDVTSNEWRQALMCLWERGFGIVPDDVLATFTLRPDLLEVMSVCMCAGLTMSKDGSTFFLEQVRLAPFFRKCPPHNDWIKGEVRARWMRGSIAGKSIDQSAIAGLPYPYVPWQEHGEHRHAQYVLEKLNEITKRIQTDVHDYTPEDDQDDEDERT